MVGDSARDDVPFGRRAGALTVLLDSYGAFAAPQQRDCLRGTESEPHFFATSFAQVRHILDDQARRGMQVARVAHRACTSHCTMRHRPCYALYPGHAPRPGAGGPDGGRPHPLTRRATHACLR